MILLISECARHEHVERFLSQAIYSCHKDAIFTIDREVVSITTKDSQSINIV